MAVYLLSVGLNHYADRNIRAVHCCENDALEIYSLFSGTFGLGDCALRLTGKVYSHQVWDALQNIGNTIRNGDTFILFFAGHGYQKPDSHDQLLLLHNAYLDLLDTASPDGTIALSALKARTDQWKGVSRVFILDACRNWLSGRGEAEAFQNEAALAYLSERDPGWNGGTAHSAGLLILNATRNGESAYELETKKGQGRGAMAFALEKVLRLRHQQGQPVWLDKKLVGEVAHKMGELFYESGISSVKQTPFLTPPNGRVLLHKPQAGNNNNTENKTAATESGKNTTRDEISAAQADDRLIRALRESGGAHDADNWRRLRQQMQTAGGKQRCEDMLAVLQQSVVKPTPPQTDKICFDDKRRIFRLRKNAQSLSEPDTKRRKILTWAAAGGLLVLGGLWLGDSHEDDIPDESSDTETVGDGTAADSVTEDVGESSAVTEEIPEEIPTEEISDAAAAAAEEVKNAVEDAGAETSGETY